MPPDADRRHQTARAAAHALRDRAAELAHLPALVGFDGFIDDILHPVRTRRSMAQHDYEPISTITEFADRCRAAAGLSTNIELVRLESRPGGNGPLLASGLASLGSPTTFIGCVASPDDHATLHPIYAPLAARCARVIPLAPPGHTDALEFSDGKIMFNQTAPVQAATWDAILARVGTAPFTTLLTGAALLGIVNWSLCAGVESIWRALIDTILPTLPPHQRTRRRAFIDLSDPAKRTDDDLHRAMALLASLNTRLPVTLGLNLAEARRLAHLFSLPFDSAATTPGPALAALAHELRHATTLDTLVIHPRHGAAAANASATPTWFLGPLTRTPRLSTGAGDHFNAGFAVAQSLDLPLDQCLAIATATSGAYVRDAQSPTLARVCSLLDNLPMPDAD